MKFYVKQKLFSAKNKFTIFNENEEEAYKVEGKLFSLQNYLELRRMDDSVVYSTQKKILSLMPKYTIFDAVGKEVGKVFKKFSFRPRFDVFTEDERFYIEGSVFAHSFGITNGEQTVAEIKKKVFKLTDSYEIEIFEDKDVELFLFIVIMIDQILHEGRNNSYNG
jgi:uncharacterized protein YxjI